MSNNGLVSLKGEALKKYLENVGYATDVRILPDGWYVAIRYVYVGYAIILGYDPKDYVRRWDYDTEEQARAALKDWNPMTQPEPRDGRPYRGEGGTRSGALKSISRRKP